MLVQDTWPLYQGNEQSKAQGLAESEEQVGRKLGSVLILGFAMFLNLLFGELPHMYIPCFVAMARQHSKIILLVHLKLVQVCCSWLVSY